MKRVLPLALATLIAVPVTASYPSHADAQVRVGAGARRTAPRPRPRLTEAEEDRLYAAQDEVAQLDEKISALQEASEAGALTEAQRQEWQAHTTQRQAAQATVDRLEAKRRS
jgi:hypothetical protein